VEEPITRKPKQKTLKEERGGAQRKSEDTSPGPKGVHHQQRESRLATQRIMCKNKNRGGAVRQIRRKKKRRGERQCVLHRLLKKKKKTDEGRGKNRSKEILTLEKNEVYERQAKSKNTQTRRPHPLCKGGGERGVASIWLEGRDRGHLTPGEKKVAETKAARGRTKTP